MTITFGNLPIVLTYDYIEDNIAEFLALRSLISCIFEDMVATSRDLVKGEREVDEDM